MEQYIIYVVIAISVIANIYKNFKKQQEANEKRALGKSVPQPQVAQSKPAPTLFQSPKEKAAQKATQPIVADKSKSVIESDIEQFKKNRSFTSSMEYASLESSIGNYSSLGDSALFVPMTEDFDNIGSIEDDDIKDEQPVTVKPHALFETKDDFRKAIIYSAVFERKYA